MRIKKPVIAISYDYNDWILKRWADNIKKNYSNKYDIILFTHYDFENNKEVYLNLLKDVDIIHMMVPFYVNYIKEILPNSIVINSFHHWCSEPEVEPFLENSDVIMTVSNEWKDKLIHNYNIDENKIFIVHCGIEKRFLNNNKTLYKKDNKITIGFFAKASSNEYDRKGTRHFISLLNVIRKNKLINKFRIIISGTGWDDIISNIKDFEIIYNTFTEDYNMPSLYKSLDFYLILSDIEGGPASILEAMASKTMVISTNVGLVKDIGIDNHNCSIIDNTNAEEILNKILYYNNNKNEYYEIIENAYNTAKNMTYNNTFKIIGDMYDYALSKVNYLSNKKLDINYINCKFYNNAPSVNPSNIKHYACLSLFKISFIVNYNILEKIIWWIPLKKVRDNIKIRLKDQTRPDQTRPDQTRPDLICRDYIYIYNNLKRKKLQPMLQYNNAA